MAFVHLKCLRFHTSAGGSTPVFLMQLYPMAWSHECVEQSLWVSIRLCSVSPVMILRPSSLAGLQGGTNSLLMAPKCCRPSKLPCLGFPRITAKRPEVEELVAFVTSSQEQGRVAVVCDQPS